MTNINLNKISLFDIQGHYGLNDENTAIPKFLFMATKTIHIWETVVLLALIPSPILRYVAPWHAASTAARWCSCPGAAAFAYRLWSLCSAPIALASALSTLCVGTPCFAACGGLWNDCW